MAVHRRIRDMENDTEGARRFPPGVYYGFVIGPGFLVDQPENGQTTAGLGPRGPEHDLVMLEGVPLGGGKGDVLLRPGMVLPCEPIESEPLIRPVRGTKVMRTAHVIGLTSAAELAIAPPKRAPWSRRPSSNQASTETLVVPFAGRRHLRWCCEVVGADTVTITVFGRTRWGTGASDYSTTTLDAGTACATGTTVGGHEGGTDSEEILDEVVVVATPSSATSWKLSVDAIGELGGA